MSLPVSAQLMGQLGSVGPLAQFMMGSRWTQRAGQPGISDFVVGNPHEMPLPAFVSALQRHAEPQHPGWFAYSFSNPAAQETIAAGLRERRGLPFEWPDILLTNGAFAALAVALRAVVDPGDEVVYVSPPWFFYEAIIAGSGATPVRVRVHPETFDLDIDALAAALTPRTRAVIVNSPHNPTGRIYPAETLAQLGAALTEASERNGRRIYLLSDEAYSRIVFDGREFPTPVAHYPASFLIYTYGKTLLTPGQRLGYIAMPPAMPERETLRRALLGAQILTGYAIPNMLLQHALPEIEQMSIDIAHLQGKRDLMVSSLRESGYDLHSPEGTFYLLPRSPIPDDMAFTQRLAERDIFVLPGTLAEMPGYFRISLTANDDMIERALPIFTEVRRAAAGAV